MAKFYVDPRSPIVAELIRQDFNFEESEALRLIDMDEAANNTDGTFALGTGGACIVATAGTLALSGFTLPILLPAIGVGLCGVTYWNSKVAARSREMETQFLSDHPEVLVKVQNKLRAGESRETIAAPFEQCLRAYRWGDVAQMTRVLGTTQAQSGLQPTNDQDAPRTESQALAQTELQPIVAAPPSMVQSKETSAPTAGFDYLARIKLVIARNKNFFIGGMPGSGKGVVTSNLIRWKLDQYPGSIACWIDPKGSNREDGNFADPRITRLSIKGVGMSTGEYAIEVAEMLEQARTFIHKCDIENGKRVWIIFDEIMNLKQKLDKKQFKEIQDLLVDCVSMGDDQGLHVIAITQSFNAGDTVGSDELLKNLSLIACLKEDDYPRAKKLVQFGKTNHDEFSIEEYSRLVKKSPRDRVMCVGGTFIPAPEMPLLSGWDRDKNVKTATPIATPAESTFTTEAIQTDDFSNLPALFRSVAMMAMAAQTASDRSVIQNDLNHAEQALKSNDLSTVRERLKKYV